MSVTAKSYQARVRARLRASGVVAPGWLRVEEGERRRRRRGSRAARRRSRPSRPAAGAGRPRRRRGASCRRSCRAARPAGSTPSIRSIRKNGVPSTEPVGSMKLTARHGDVGQLADEPHHFVLVVRARRSGRPGSRRPPAPRARRTRAVARPRPRSRWRRRPASPSSCRWRRCPSAARPRARRPPAAGREPVGERRRHLAASRLDRWSFMSAGGGAWVMLPSPRCVTWIIN